VLVEDMAVIFGADALAADREGRIREPQQRGSARTVDRTLDGTFRKAGPSVAKGQAVLPASTTCTEPVMFRPPSPSRNSTLRATSTGSMSRWSALRRAI